VTIPRRLHNAAAHASYVLHTCVLACCALLLTQVGWAYAQAPRHDGFRSPAVSLVDQLVARSSGSSGWRAHEIVGPHANASLFVDAYRAVDRVRLRLNPVFTGCTGMPIGW